MADSIALCRCSGTGRTIEGDICIAHLRNAYEVARMDHDLELMAVIIKKQKDLSRI